MVLLQLIDALVTHADALLTLSALVTEHYCVDSGQSMRMGGALTLSTLVTTKPTSKKPYHLIDMMRVISSRTGCVAPLIS